MQILSHINKYKLKKAEEFTDVIPWRETDDIPWRDVIRIIFAVTDDIA